MDAFKTCFLIIVVFALTINQGGSQGLLFQETDDVLQLWDQGRQIYSYQKTTKSQDGKYPRANYLHPLYDFQGNALTEDFPEDHPHHRGIFWAWHQLQIDGISVADPWECRDLEWLVQKVSLQQSDSQALLSAEVHWKGGTPRQLLIKEDLLITYRGYRDHYTLDFDITLNLVRALQLGGSQDEKGYGGFSARFALGNPVKFQGVSGVITPRETQVQAGNWIKISGLGAANSEVVIMYDEASTADLKGWILRASGSMQNAVWPGRHAVTLSPEKPISLRTRLIIYRHKAPPSQEIERQYRNYSDPSASFNRR